MGRGGSERREGRERWGIGKGREGLCQRSRDRGKGSRKEWEEARGRREGRERAGKRRELRGDGKAEEGEGINTEGRVRVGTSERPGRNGLSFV